MTLNIFGVRHHGTGCSRALVSELERYCPDLILVEGPPEGTSALKIDGLRGATAPLALIVYPESDPRRAAIYPFAEFSPEWVAIRYALATNVPVQFIDLPASNAFALEDAWKRDSEESESELQATMARLAATDHDLERMLAFDVLCDPLGAAARLAGESRPELWEEQVVEQAPSPDAIFPFFLDLMTESRLFLRDLASIEAEDDDATACDEDESPPGTIDQRTLKRLAAAVTKTSGGSFRKHEALREASMRRLIRGADKSGAKRVAVVCGAWHAPALDLETTDPRRRSLIPKKSTDDALLKNLPKSKTAATWIPWTASRFDRRSGYGAGIDAPAWLLEIWRASPESRRLVALETGVAAPPSDKYEGRDAFRIASARFLARAAQTLREDHMETASANVVGAANVVAAANVAEALAAINGRPAPSVEELREAVKTALCGGQDALYATIRERVEVGSEVGSVPAGTPITPLAKDIEKERRRLRIPRDETERVVDVDLREKRGREKSRFFRRLEFIGIAWGTILQGGYARGSFRERRVVVWNPEFEVMIVDASRYGSTLEEAASASAIELLDRADTIKKLVTLVEAALCAELNDQSLTRIYERLQESVALTQDVADAIEAIPELATLLRYGTARGPADARLTPIFDALFERVTPRLREVCVNLSLDVARNVADKLDLLAESVALLQDSARTGRLYDAFVKVALDAETNDYVAGRLARTLFDRKRWSRDELASKLDFFLAPTVAPEEFSAWLEGFLHGAASAVLYLDELWRVLDARIMSYGEETFMEQLPLIRRAFDSFSGVERRNLSQLLPNLWNDGFEDDEDANLGDEERVVWSSPEMAPLASVVNSIFNGLENETDDSQGGSCDK